LELADTSAWTNRHKDDPVANDFDARLVAGEIATCPIVVLELLWTTQKPSEFSELRDDLGALPQVEINGAVWERAIEVWQALVDAGRHRQANHVDLIVAAAAELGAVGLCHYDSDFDAIAEITGQTVRAIAPIGSL
jgi:predicted nucleic acid-binding protein